MRSKAFSAIVTLIFSFASSYYLIANPVFLSGPCDGNDICSTAQVFPAVASDQSYVCVNGCNFNAAPDTIVSACQMGDFPTVWYEVDVDAEATVMNIEVRTEDFESPVISLFDGTGGCDHLEQVSLTNGNLSCVIGSHGMAMAVGTTIIPSGRYYIAVSSLLSIGGDFKICVSTIANGSVCVTDRNLEIKARSNGGSLEGPFDPGEKVTICMNVNNFTGVANGCQWFQGMVPVFGNGWDPSSFDSIGQPLNASINGLSFDSLSNGNYGASKWEWFNDVGYHHDNSMLKIGDFDGNGRKDLCNGSYEIDCPNQPGITGGCCGPCWDDPGTGLPGGWFAYGINGTCPTSGPPISVDWGDGNTCGAVMGPWKFCYDLVTRDTPDCLGDSTRHDLTIGYFTFADGETGSWTGGPSVCALDQPVKTTLKALCGKVTRHTPEWLPNLHSGDIFQYQITEQDISTWEWNVSPARILPLPVYTGENGITIQGKVGSINKKQLITGIFIGHVSGSADLVVKKIYFYIMPGGPVADILSYEGNDKLIKGDSIQIKNPITSSKITNRSNQSDASLLIYPTPSVDKVTLQWKPLLGSEATITFYNSDGTLIQSFPVLKNDVLNKVIDISGFAPGVYIVCLNSNAEHYVSKMVRI